MELASKRRCRVALHEEIAKLAYELYEKSGRLEGRDLENWCEAERIVLARLAGKEKTGKGKAETPAKIEKANKDAGKVKKGG